MSSWQNRPQRPLYGIVPHPVLLPVTDFALIGVPLAYSIIRYNLFIDEAKVIFGRTFLYSSLAIVSSTVIYLIVVTFTLDSFASIRDLVLPFVLFYLLLATHPIYNWVSTFFRDFIYNISSGYSIVTDDEVAQSLREYQNLERLSESSLLRLGFIEQSMRNKKFQTPVDALRSLVKESVEYFKPDTDFTRRIKPNLKYQLLKMFAFDEAEEGQILWELGFDDYPVKILSQERKYRSPLFKVISPSDYTFTSRNAYLALKREAIHDVTWRISYLEKQAKKRSY